MPVWEVVLFFEREHLVRSEYDILRRDSKGGRAVRVSESGTARLG